MKICQKMHASFLYFSAKYENLGRNEQNADGLIYLLLISFSESLLHTYSLARDQSLFVDNKTSVH